MSPLIGLYRAATILFEAVSRPYLRRRVARGKEDLTRIGERSGIATVARPSGPLVWLHGASIGEGLAVLPLIERLVERGFGILVTTGTVTSAHVLANRLPAKAQHQFVPLDVPRAMRRFLDHWNPQLAILAESELWPNLMVETSARLIPLVLVNARLSRRSFRRWRLVPGFIGPLLARIDICLPQTQDDADRLTALKAPRVAVTGNLKFDAAPPPADGAALRSLVDAIGARPMWVAASTHEDEETTIIAAHRRLSERWPDLLTIIVPRHANRGSALAALATSHGLRFARRSQSSTVTAATELYIADTFGELGLFYRLASIVYVGKSLGSGGGQNPIEAAKLGCAIVHGPSVANFDVIYRQLDSSGGARIVTDETSLVLTLDRLVADVSARAAVADAAARIVRAGEGATDRTMAAIEPFLAAHLSDHRG